MSLHIICYTTNFPGPPPPITEGDDPVDSQPGTEPDPTPVKPVGDVSYYYAGSQRIAMRIGNETYFLFGDHLGSTSVVLDASGQIVEKGYYLPWGGTRGEETITSTDYGYTGQMREGDIYYYGARWPKVPEAELKGFDPAIGRFMQADTIVPLQVQGTQAFDRYAYVNNNPFRYTDPSGNYFQVCDDHYGRGCAVPTTRMYNGNIAASVMSSGPRPTDDISGTFCTWAVSWAANQGGIPENGVWFNSIESEAWIRTPDNYDFWINIMRFGYFESSEIPADYDYEGPDSSRRESIFTYETLHREIESISSKIQVGDLVYYMDPTVDSRLGVPIYTHVAMVTDLVNQNGTLIPYISEVDGPANGYGGHQISLPRSMFDTDNVHIMKIAIIFMGRK